MKSKLRKQIEAKHKRFEEILKAYYVFFDKKYPGWETGPDADYIKKRLNQAAQKESRNRLKRKMKTLFKKDFQDWPFKSDSIILIQTSKKMISCIHNNKKDIHEYALNGIAESGLNIKTISAAGKQIDGKSIMPFIQLGLKL